MRLSIKVAVLGQDLSWVLSKRYLGLFTIALAIATFSAFLPKSLMEVCYEVAAQQNAQRHRQLSFVTVG
jgi:hypothetical protein